MPSSRQTPSVEPEPLTHEDIIAREQAAVRLRRRRWWLGGTGFIVLGLLAGFGARPALRMAKAWQARRVAAEARRLMDEDKWLEARQKATDAYALWQGEPEAVRTIALFLNRVGNPRQALPFWQQLDELHATTPQDQRDVASAELGVGDLDAAEAHLGLAWPPGTPGTPADWPLGMQIALRRDHASEAAALARRILADPATPERPRLTAAAVLLSNDPQAEAQTLGRKVFTDVAAGNKSAASLEALTALSRWQAAAVSAGKPNPALPPLPDLITRIEAHPLAKVPQQLYALDLRAVQDPARRAEFIQQAMDRYSSTKNEADLAALTAWLYSQKAFEMALSILPPERADSDRTLFLQRLDALAALSRWNDVRAEIQAGKFPLEPITAQMYLARCAAQLGEPRVRDACWETALGDAGTDAGKLLTVGEYAQKNGMLTIADKALQAAVNAAPDWREANTALVRSLETTGQTIPLREALAAFGTHYPKDRSLANDHAYIDALLNVDASAARETARRLVQTEPTSLPHRVTLALAELRLGNNLAALDAFKGLTMPNPATMLPRQRAVYAATLWATSYEHDAQALARGIPPDQLLPEERTLIQPILDASTP